MRSTVLVGLICSLAFFAHSPIADSSPEWSSPSSLTDPGQSAGSAVTLSRDDGESLSLWWDRGEGAVKAIRFSSQGRIHESIVALPPNPGIDPKLTSVADDTLTKIGALVPFNGSGDNFLAFVRSDNGGQSWSSPTRASTALLYPRLLASADLSRILLVGVHESAGVRTLRVVRSNDGGSTWSQPQILTTAVRSWYSISLTSVSDANMGTAAIFLSYSAAVGSGSTYEMETEGFVTTDGGASWQDGLSISGWGVRNAALAPQTQEILAVVEGYAQQPGGSTTIIGRTRATGLQSAWQQPEQFESSSLVFGISDIAISDDGRSIAFAWGSRVGSPSEDRLNIALSSNAGISWTAGPIPNTSPRGGFVPPDGLRMSSDGGKLALMWSRWRAGDSDELVTSTSSDGGSTWSPPQSHSAVNIRSFRRPEANLWLSPQGADARVSLLRPSGLITKSSSDSGVAWSDPTFLTRPVAPAGSPRLIRHSDTQLLASWTRFREDFGAYLEISRSVDGGDTWSEPMTLSSSRLSVSSSFAFATGAGKTLGVWREFHEGADAYQMVRSLDLGATWNSLDLSIIPAASNLIELKVARQSGRAVLFFEDLPSGSGAIMTSVSTDGGESWSHPQAIAQRMQLIDTTISDDGQHLNVALQTSAGGVGPEIRTSSDGGHTWATSFPVASNAPYFRRGQFQASLDGTRVSFISNELSILGHSLERRYSADGGRTWWHAAPERISGPGAWQLATAGSSSGWKMIALWGNGSQVLWSQSSNGGVQWRNQEPLPPLRAVSPVQQSGTPIVGASADGDVLIALAVAQAAAGPDGSGQMKLVASSSSSFGDSWSPTAVLDLSSGVRGLAISVAEDGTTAAALWIAEQFGTPGSQAPHIRFAKGRELDSWIFSSGFEP